MTAAAKLEGPIHRNRRLDASDRQREACTGLYDVQLGGNLDRAAKIVRPGAKLIGQREQNPPNFLRFLLFERDDVVIDLNGLERFYEQTGAARRSAVDDAGNRGAMLGANHQHVAAVAVGDHLFLQVFRVPSAQKPVERRPQALLLFAQALAN